MSLSACSPFVDTEMIVCARKMGARLAEAPLDDRPRTSGTAKGATLSNLVRAVNELGTLYLRGVRLISTERADTSWLPRAEASGTDGFAQRR